MGANGLCHGNEISALIKEKVDGAMAKGALEFGNAVIDGFRSMAIKHGGDKELTVLHIIKILKLARDDVKRVEVVK